MRSDRLQPRRVTLLRLQLLDLSRTLTLRKVLEENRFQSGASRLEAPPSASLGLKMSTYGPSLMIRVLRWSGCGFHGSRLGRPVLTLLTPVSVIPGAEGAVFSKSVETPHVRAEPFKELRLESPTRSLLMEAPKGVEIQAEAGDIRAICRNELRLESKDGEIALDAQWIRLLRLPEGKASTGSLSSGTRQTVYEVCVCPNGRLFLSQAGTGSTCQINNNVCL
uniref:Sarcoglycan delta n=1 Tax=Oryzias sinensis TaxID=183150 RepID=A0A8C7Z1H0_9TELE